jgi:hypothetical protein
VSDRLTNEEVERYTRLSGDVVGAGIFVPLAREVKAWRDKCAEVGVPAEPDVLVKHHRAQGMVIGAANERIRWLTLIKGGPCPECKGTGTCQCERCEDAAWPQKCPQAPANCIDGRTPGIIDRLEAHLADQRTTERMLGHYDDDLEAIIADLRKAVES